MRVAFVLTQDRGGPVDLTVALARELAGRPGGPAVMIAGPEPLTSAGDVAGLLRPVRVRSKTDVRGGRQLGRVLRRWAPDVVHAQDRRAALAATTVARAGAPVAATYHGVPDGAAGLWVEEGPLAGRRPTAGSAAVLAADALVARRVAVTLAPSAAMAGFLRRRLRVPAAKLRVVPNGVALPAPRPPAGPARTFVSVGTFAPSKSVATLVDAFADVARTRPHLRLLLVGDGDERIACERRAAALGVGAVVEFTGYRTDVPTQLARAEAFVLPSVNENLPLALMEAMGAGLACVASRVGAVPELLADGTGLLVPPDDVAALAAAMASLADDPGLAHTLGKAAAAAARRFSVAACADAHQALWRALR
ncbi:MAG TPA: glycosyltransferase family 4 protein [Actinomycetes bacterium]|jgi:glycosyltransferase involved in cell wall biosynthesis|nr:glycosyltransferase family 4 protein [Actinomycetes bacterium]